jgi:glycosyltransferase involved in cell wall biosynthesis
MAQDPRLDFQVAYCSLRGAQAGYDAEFGTTVKWDVPLLEGYSWMHVPNRGSDSQSFFGLCNPGLWNFIRSGAFDAVWSNLGYVQSSFWISYFAARSCGAVFLFGCDQGSLQSRTGSRWRVHIKRLIWPLLYGLPDQITASSTRAKGLLQTLGVPETRISLTLLCVDNQWWVQEAAKVNRRAVRQAWGASEEDVVLLFCAKLQDWKRPFDLLRAFARLQQTNVRLIFAGDGPLRAQIEREAAILGVSERVRFLGFVNQSQLPAVYASSDLLILPSEYEPFGVVINEAMCCGCPAIVSDRVGAGPDLVEPIGSTLIFPCGNIDALVQRLSGLVANPGRLHEISRLCISHMQVCSPQRTAALIGDAVERGVSNRRAALLGEPSASSTKSSVSGIRQT